MNCVFKDHVQLHLYCNEHACLSFKEILYMADRIEAQSYKPGRTPFYLRGLVEGTLTRHQKTYAYRRLYWTYRFWSRRELFDLKSIIVAPFIALAREQEERRKQLCF